ncbi:ATP-dependent Clp protease proteolytic subunit ClpP [Isosphaera pallida ATCC 43644]|jgi:ATP-dependent Clp protease protease subunit|uniref:ATP-dependent Clp protease proteolytic subunit n=1 Tax=Isosphaera pallida (strain ATCC 43644 / DSM 9630 / IS1B) TaxID=575540 RepID=E8QXC7_ISOPI|nr:ATP-dependent Clp protease proteolytic subunit [Isosphaera pallida]ADV61968.1 ATP-dependent Clp protease proteolytic subunit ClpP [Isosphaera pallida ATCC 43644]
MPMVPIVIERGGREERAMDIYSRLLQDRIIMLSSILDDVTANLIVAQLLVLAHQDAKAEISLYLNSPGGSLTGTMAVYDTMQFIGCPVATYCIGMAASGAAILLAGGTKGRRHALPHSKIMLHQPYGHVGGQVSDISIQAAEVLRNKAVVEKVLARRTGRSEKQIESEIKRDRYLSAPEALEFGLIDHIVEDKSEIKDAQASTPTPPPR